ncbi:MAG TPA: hypothetical protein VFQ61_20840, partial [Polyangiaceae bacterium]|nr:hypothetical protein [Polyangiaceae bacterium]
GRHASFRQLTARVAGPDGHTREVNLEPTGAGQYIAHLPVNQPGSYLASLLDDSAQSLGTTGAVLSRGDELRPTGTDRALLRRISELSSGKVRDTLAGIFNDRDARRFAYDALSGWLAAMAALCLLGSVAIRRIHLPPLRWPGREHTAAKPGTYAGNSDSAAYANQGLEALRAVRERLRARAPMAADAQAAGGAPTASKGENDTLLTAAPKETTPARFVLGPEAPAARSSMPESPGTSQANEPVTPSVAHAAPAPTPSPTRTKSAAEILLERRRARR